jgi:hypothetical protein
MRILAIFAAAAALSGCVTSIAKTAYDVATLPVKAASKGVDLATTSQAEADQKRGREVRKAEEQRGRELRQMEERCRNGRPLQTDDCRSFQAR